MTTRILKAKPLSFLRLALVASAGFSLLFTDGHAQVVIEGGPGPIQRSDQDGRPEPAVPGAVPESSGRVPQSAIGVETRAPKAVEIQPNPNSSVTVRVPVEPSAATKAAEPGSVTSAVPVVDVAAAKRKAELIRELGIASSGTGARVAFTTENLYEKDSALITIVAIPQLQLLAEFIRLSDHEGITVTYHFTPALRIEKLAWERSVSLVQWMKTIGGIPEGVFTVKDPEIVSVTDPAPAPVAGAEAILPVDSIEIVVDYR